MRSTLLLPVLLLSACLTSSAEYQAMYDYASDDDGDGFAEAHGDCDDDAPDTYPGAPDVWYDGVDSDCGGNNDHDRDGDGHMRVVDCDEDDDQVHPGAVDDCNGVDDDCDGEVDEGLSQVWYFDADGDGDGVSEDRVSGCLAPEGYVADGGDCDDAAPAAYPGAEAICGDGVDNDCDGLGDCGFALSGEDRVSSDMARVVGTDLSPLRRFSVLGGHDWTGDGGVDLVVGAPEASSGATADGNLTTEGAVYLLSAMPDGEVAPASAAVEMRGEPGRAYQLGGAIAAGAPTADGTKRLYVGASTEPGSEDSLLAGYFFAVTPPFVSDLGPLDSRNSFRVDGERPGDEFGASIVLGSFLGDETSDLAIGAPGVDFSSPAPNSGAVYLFEGPIDARSVDVDDMDFLRITGSDGLPGARMGAQLLNPGDLDGDGRDDLVIALPGVEGGRVAAVFDEPVRDTKFIGLGGAELCLTDSDGAGLGAAMVALGDMDQDGLPDLLLSAPGYSVGADAGAGRAWVVSGGLWAASPEDTLAPSEVDLASLSGDVAGGALGSSAASLGDLDGDGAAALLIGAPGQGTRGYGEALVYASPLQGALTVEDALYLVEGISGFAGVGGALGAAGDLDGFGTTELALGWDTGDGGFFLLGADAF